MARGGARQGAGRPAGSATTKTREIANRIASEGLTPLEYLLSVMRDEALEDSKRIDAAKSAAPYVHAKLASVEANIHGELGVTVEIIRFTDDAR